jgi:septum formation protein
MHFEDLKKYTILLASKSPRRHYLLKELGLDFEVRTKEVDESFPEQLKAAEIPLYLCEKKAAAFDEELTDNTIVITADTIVWLDGHVLNKPQNYNDAVRMLQLLSGKMHEVYTGVCLKSKHKKTSFVALTKVYFKELSLEEIEFYIRNYNPYDKAGAYGAQEWIGYIAVDRIEGTYFNVMGLPVRELYEALLKF